jgi:hypothetical protein
MVVAVVGQHDLTTGYVVIFTNLIPADYRY